MNVPRTQQRSFAGELRTPRGEVSAEQVFQTLARRWNAAGCDQKWDAQSVRAHFETHAPASYFGTAKELGLSASVLEGYLRGRSWMPGAKAPEPPAPPKRPRPADPLAPAAGDPYARSSFQAAPRKAAGGCAVPRGSRFT